MSWMASRYRFFPCFLYRHNHFSFLFHFLLLIVAFFLLFKRLICIKGTSLVDISYFAIFSFFSMRKLFSVLIFIGNNWLCLLISIFRINNHLPIQLRYIFIIIKLSFLDNQILIILHCALTPLHIFIHFPS